MDITYCVIMILACTGASFVQRVSGFGFGIFIMTMLPFILPSYGEATTLSGILSATQCIWVLLRVYKHISWRRLLPIMLAFLIVSYFAVGYVATAGDALIKHIFGTTLIALSIYFFVFSERISVRPSLPIQLSMGALSGIMGGLFAMQGPPAVLYFVASEREKEAYLAMTQAYFFIGNVAMTFYRAHNGFFTTDVAWGWLYALPGVFIGTWLGRLVFDRVSAPLLRRIIYAYMAVSGVMALLS